MTDTQTSLPAKPPRRRGRTVFLATLLALAAGLAGAFASTAFSQSFGPHRFGPPGWHGGGFMGQLDPAQMEERADRMVRHLAIEIDATTEQQEKLRTTVKAALKDILPMRDKARATHLRARELLLAPTVDRAAIESLRTEQMALADAFTKRVADALADMASVLTLEQRRKIADHVPLGPGRGHGWRRG
jgi:Spy/CpxP family protein refolding chaperone